LGGCPPGRGNGVDTREVGEIVQHVLAELKRRGLM
jgi:hypothetical protein